MKILIVSGIFPPDIGGPANFVPRIGSWLAERGHDVTVVCWSDTVNPEDDNDYSFALFRISRHQGSRLFRLFKTALILCQQGKDKDVFFANNLDLEVRIASALCRKPTIHKVVGDRAWEVARVRNWFTGTLDEFSEQGLDWRCRVLKMVRTISLQGANVVVTPSKYLSEIVRPWLRDKQDLKVIYNSTSFPPSLKTTKQSDYHGATILTVCRLVPWKGIAEMIKVLKRIPDTRLVIAGDGEERVYYQHLTEELGLTDRVTFLGQIPKTKVFWWMGQADIFVLNSTYEGLPHVILEAMATQIPVIATKVGGTSEVVLHKYTGMLISPNQPNELENAILSLLKNEELRNNLTHNAYQWVQNSFSEEVCFQAYEKNMHDLNL